MSTPLHDPDAPATIRCDLTAHPGLAVTPLVTYDRAWGIWVAHPGRWCIGHRQSGVYISGATWPRTVAHRIAARLAATGIDWTQPLAALSATPAATEVVATAQQPDGRWRGWTDAEFAKVGL